jgi:hypothetical protein
MEVNLKELCSPASRDKTPRSPAAFGDLGPVLEADFLFSSQDSIISSWIRASSNQKNNSDDGIQSPPAYTNNGKITFENGTIVVQVEKQRFAQFFQFGRLFL